MNISSITDQHQRPPRLKYSNDSSTLNTATMPALFRHRTPSPDTIPVYSSTPPKAVAFASGSSPVTSISRPLSNAERWTLYYFESHARLCSACVDPYVVHKSHRRLCSEGHRLAQDVAKIMYSTHRGRDVYDAVASTKRNVTAVRIELPRDYDEVRSLLKAMERSLRHRNQKPIVSFDKTYRVSQYPIVTAPSRRQSYVESVRASLDADVRHPTPRRSSSTSRSPPRSSSRKSERRSSMTVDWPQQALTYDVRAPPSTWRNSIALPRDSIPVQHTEPKLRPAFQRASRSYGDSTLVASSARAVAGDRPRTPDQRPASSHSSKGTPFRNSPVARPSINHAATVPAEPPLTTGALQSARRDVAATPATPPRQTAVAPGPAPDAPRPRRTSMLITGEQKRASWYAGQPYETEIREPKSVEIVEKEKEKERKKARRYSAYLY